MREHILVRVEEIHSDKPLRIVSVTCSVLAPRHEQAPIAISHSTVAEMVETGHKRPRTRRVEVLSLGAGQDDGELERLVNVTRLSSDLWVEHSSVTYRRQLLIVLRRITPIRYMRIHEHE